MNEIKITQVRSRVSRQKDQGRTLKALGLRHIHDSVQHPAKPDILGMVNKVIHLVKVEEVKS